jgi:hypothetical protein
MERKEASLRFMDDSPADSMMVGRLRSLLTKTTAMVLDVTDADTAWNTPWAHSQAGAELTEEETRRPRPQTGSWPWLMAPIAARLALQVAIEESRGFSAVLASDAASYAADVLCRAVLESSSLAWWLLDPAIGAETRLARSLAYRLHTALETTRAIDHLGLGPDEDRSEYGELPEAVEQEIGHLGPAWTWKTWGRSGASVSWGEGKEEEQSWPSYTYRVEDLVRHIWPQQKLPYAVLSAVAHAELLGLARNLPPPGIANRPRLRERTALRPVSDPAGFWLWHDTYVVLGALVFTADRAAVFLRLEDQLTALRTWTGELNSILPTLRPSTP